MNRGGENSRALVRSARRSHHLSDIFPLFNHVENRMRAMGARDQAARGRVVLRYAVAASERRPPDRPFEVARLHDLLHGRQIASMTPKNEPNDRASQASVAAAHSSVAWLRRAALSS